MQKEGIAIVGIGCRFPGGINDAESFWKFLVDGREAVSEVPPDRWNLKRYHDPEPGIAGKSITCRGGFISGIDQFDPQFFGISRRGSALRRSPTPASSGDSLGGDRGRGHGARLGKWNRPRGIRRNFSQRLSGDSGSAVGLFGNYLPLAYRHGA
jgi:Polyketide synthase modules and related proteins